MNAPAPLTTRGDPRLTTDLWEQRKPGGTLGRTCSRPIALDLAMRRLEPVAVSGPGGTRNSWERSWEQLGRAGQETEEAELTRASSF